MRDSHATWRRRRQLKKFNKKAGVTALLVAPFILAAWIATRPPATSKAAAEDIFAALERGDARSIYKFLIKDEKEALGLTQEQTEKILSDVVCPAFSALNAQVAKKQYIPALFSSYYKVPFSSKGVNGSMMLCILEHNPGVFQTSLTHLYIGIRASEMEIGRKTGTEPQVNQKEIERMKQLESLGMIGLYDEEKRVTSKFLAHQR